jgi:hypothetical protein
LIIENSQYWSVDVVYLGESCAGSWIENEVRDHVKELVYTEDEGQTLVWPRPTWQLPSFFFFKKNKKIQKTCDYLLLPPIFRKPIPKISKSLKSHSHLDRPPPTPTELPSTTPTIATHLRTGAPPTPTHHQSLSLSDLFMRFFFFLMISQYG